MVNELRRRRSGRVLVSVRRAEESEERMGVIVIFIRDREGVVWFCPWVDNFKTYKSLIYR